MRLIFSKWLKKNAPKALAAITFLSSTRNVEATPMSPRDLYKLPLEDGRILTLDQLDALKWKLSLLGADKKEIWSHAYEEEELDAFWNGAHFTYVMEGKLATDLSQNGFLEIAVSTWAGGNSPCNTAIIFTVKPEELVVYKVIQHYSFESSLPVLKENHEPSYTSAMCEKPVFPILMGPKK